LKSIIIIPHILNTRKTTLYPLRAFSGSLKRRISCAPHQTMKFLAETFADPASLKLKNSSPNPTIPMPLSFFCSTSVAGPFGIAVC